METTKSDFLDNSGSINFEEETASFDFPNDFDNDTFVDNISENETEEFENVATKISTSENKLYFSIAELSEIIDEEPHVIRYWGEKITQLKWHKRNGHKYYTNKQVEAFNIVKKFIREDKITLAGAKKFLNNNLKQNKNLTSNRYNSNDNIVLSREDFSELLEILQLLLLYIKMKEDK